MVDDVKDIIETAESKASQEVLDRARLARERREAEQRKRLDELRAHAAAAQAQREKRDEDRRRRQAEQRARDDDRRVQVEERKRAIWEASISRREALLQRERDRSERLERQRAARSTPRPAFAFGSSTPRLLEPLDSAGFFWAARSTNPIDQMNFFESLAASTTNVMFASAPLTRRASALQLDVSDSDNKDEPDRQLAPLMWSSVARRRTDLVPTVPAPRAPETRSGETTPGSRPGSALSNATGVVRRPSSAPRKPRPASIAGTGVNTPRDLLSQSVASTPCVSRDSTALIDATRRAPASASASASAFASAHTPAPAPRRPRPASLYANSKPATPVAPGDGKPPVHRKPKPSKEHEKTPRGKSQSASPGRALSPSPRHSKEPSLDKDVPLKSVPAEAPAPASQVSAAEVTHKLEALQIQNGHDRTLSEKQPIERQEASDAKESKIEAPEMKPETKLPDKPNDVQKEPKPIEVQKEHKSIEVKEVQKQMDKKEPSQEKADDSDMTASMIGRKITTEEEAKAALAERRRRAREELERQAELERQRLQREEEEEMERQRVEEERQRREEEEARELARLQRSMDDEKLRKAIEVQQQLEREEAERKLREEAEKQARLREDEEKRKAAEEAEKLRREEAEREEKERLARKQRVEAIMARTRLRKAEEDKKQQENKSQPAAPTPAPAVDNDATPPVDNGALTVDNGATPHVDNGAAPVDNGNVATDDLLGFNTSQVEIPQVDSSPPLLRAVEALAPAPASANGNHTADLLGLSQPYNTEDKIVEQTTKPVENPECTNNGNGDGDGHHIAAHAAHAGLSASFIQNEIANEQQTKLDHEDFTTHNGHGHTHPLTLQNAI